MNVYPRRRRVCHCSRHSPPPAAGRPVPKDLLPTPKRLDEIARALSTGAWRHVSWREGTRGTMQGRFARAAIWASHGYTQRQHQSERTREWLFVEWPRESDAPTDYWLAHLPGEAKAPTPARLAGPARERWHVEQDYRELEEEPDLDHFEGRSWLGWHHHVSLVCLAHLFLQSERTQLSARVTQKKSGAAARAAAPAADPSSAARRARADGLRALFVV